MDHTEVQDVLWFGIAATPIIIAIVQLAKMSFKLPSQWAPVLAVVLGLAGGYFFHLSGEDNHTLYQALTGGLLAGLSAAGLYSGVKAVGSH